MLPIYRKCMFRWLIDGFYSEKAYGLRGEFASNLRREVMWQTIFGTMGSRTKSKAP